MQRYIYVIISFFLAVTLSAAPIAAQTDVAAAPSPTQEQEQVQEQVQAQNSETPPLSDALKTPKRAQEPSEEPGFDLSDPALTEALAARAQADRAIAEAVRAQQDKNQLSAAAPAADIAPKKSVFPTDPEQIKALGEKILNTVLGWLTSPAFLAQLGALVIIWWLLAPLLAAQLRQRVFLFRGAPKTGDKLFTLRKYIYDARDLVRPLLIIALLALAAMILKSALGQDWLIKLAQGFAVVFLVYTAIKQFAPNELMKKIGLWIGIPLALLMVFGYFDDLLAVFDGIALGDGDNAFSVLTLIKLALFGSAFFWLGNFSNQKGQTAIRSQESLDTGVREIIAKFLQIAIFGAAAIMAMSAAGIGLGGLVVIFSALSLGIGLGLQPIAANFVSGLIILFDRSVRIGDFISLPDGQEGFVEAINMRSTTVETTDGKDIMVPNTTFTEELYENWTHKDPRQRYEVHFAVAYDTDLDALEAIIIPVFNAHPLVLSEPEQPDLELREFGQNGINFAVEFWCSGIDDGPNKFTSDLNFAVWRVLKKNGIQMPLPQREVRLLK
jgi:small-conductance mechanosensitive channel